MVMGGKKASKDILSRDNIHSSGFILCFFSENDCKGTQNGGQLRTGSTSNRYGGLGHLVAETCSESPCSVVVEAELV